MDNFKINKGFTIIEVVVASLIFVILITTSFGIFTFITKQQSQILGRQELLNQASYALEYMVRALRFAQKDEIGICLSQKGLNYENPGGEISRIKFINHLEDDICQEFFLEQETNSLKVAKGVEIYPLLSDKFQVVNLKFKLFGQLETDSFQPRVTIFLEAKKRGREPQPRIKLQTTISQRNLDEE